MLSRIRQVTVLNSFKPLLRLLNAYNRENFDCSSWTSILRNSFYVFAATMMIFTMAAFITLILWHLIEENTSLENFIVELPIAFSIFQMEVIFIALLLKNRTVISTIWRLQEIIDRRECVWPIQSYHRLDSKLSKLPFCLFLIFFFCIHRMR